VVAVTRGKRRDKGAEVKSKIDVLFSLKPRFFAPKVLFPFVGFREFED
jgi:hypothetical protein